MSTWANRARAHFLQERQTSTAETAETPLLTVLAVQSGRSCEKHDIQKQGQAAANDPAPTATVQGDLPTLDIKGLPTTPVDGAVIDIGTVRPPGLSAKLLAASMALDAQIHAAGNFDNSDENPDWCWPHSTAMTGSEIDLFAARLARFTDKGMSQSDAEALADKLVTRDRDSDDRRLCLECTHLGGFGRTSWRCGAWQAAGIAIRARDAGLPSDLVRLLQRCDGFNSAINPPTKAF